MTSPDAVKLFGAKLLGLYTGGVLTKLIEVGYLVGLFEASKQGAATSEELSLGTVWGEQTAGRYLADAGFGAVRVVDSPRPQNCIFVCGH